MKKTLLLDNWKFIQIESSGLNTIKEIIPFLKHEDDLTQTNLVLEISDDIFFEFTGNYPTPGGNRVVNRSFINYIEGRDERAY